MVPMQVRGDHCVDLVRSDAEPLQGMQQSLGLAQRDLQGALLAELGADAGLADDHLSVNPRDEADAGHVDHVVAVRGLLLLPQHLGHDAEHEAAVGLPSPGDEDVELQVTQPHGH